MARAKSAKRLEALRDELSGPYGKLVKERVEKRKIQQRAASKRYRAKQKANK